MSYFISEKDLSDLSLGAAVLGTGGGGSPLTGRLLVQECLRAGKTIEVIDPKELKDESFVVSTAMMGAPSVTVEKIPAGNEVVTSLNHLERHLNKKVDATIPMECGGLNSMIPLVAAAEAGIPVVDGDGMGRAFPELQMETFGVYGIAGSPLAISDEHGHSCIIETGNDNVRMETFARALTISMGGSAFIAEYPMSGCDVKRTAVPNTLSLALNIGRTIREAQQTHTNPLEKLSSFLKGTIYGYSKTLSYGKIVDVERSIKEGFTQGTVKIQEFNYSSSEILIWFRNENEIVYRNGIVKALVPDLITIFDSETGIPITTEELRYGQRVAVFGISTPEIMRTAEALNVFGPHAFGLKEQWIPIEELNF